MRDLIIVLGHFDQTVHLTAAGRERLELGIALLRACPDSSLTVTGRPPDGPDRRAFPRTAEAREYLAARGVHPARLYPFIDSHNTAEDAFLSEPAVSACEPQRLLIATSDYHAERARAIFEQVFSQLPVEAHGAPHPAAEDELRALVQHEKRALQDLKRNGLYRSVRKSAVFRSPPKL
ncbi:MAG: YdcF family protein [Chloroflexi bacterium]|nr:YdcF family protein [Chloroflexota bacterium]